MLILLSISYILTPSWVFLFLYEDQIGLVYQAAVLVAIAVVNFFALCAAQQANMNACQSGHQHKASRKENILFQVLVVNSIALLFGWTLLAANLSVGIAIRSHYADISPERLGFIILLSINICIALYTFLDIAYLSYTTFTLLSYASFITGAIGIYNNQYASSDSDFPLKNYITILLSTVAVFACLKLISCIINTVKYVKRRQ